MSLCRTPLSSWTRVLSMTEAEFKEWEARQPLRSGPWSGVGAVGRLKARRASHLRGSARRESQSINRQYGSSRPLYPNPCEACCSSASLRDAEIFHFDS